jgi:hypothetical protein
VIIDLAIPDSKVSLIIPISRSLVLLKEGLNLSNEERFLNVSRISGQIAKLILIHAVSCLINGSKQGIHTRGETEIVI